VIKARISIEGTPALLIGLTPENCFRLQEGKPITFRTGFLGLPEMRVVIAGGSTNDAILAEVRDSGIRITEEPDE
jgi:hypothetical protein